MTTIELTKGKEVSPALMDLITKFTTDFVNTAELWEAIKTKAEEEGFTTEEITILIRPMLKTKLTKDQIYYLFHKEEQKERVKSRNLRQNDVKKDTEESAISPKQYVDQKFPQLDSEKAVEVVDENKALRKQVEQLRQVIAKNAVTTADQEKVNFETLFEMLPNDDIDTFKNKSGNLMLFERLLVNFKHQDVHKRLKYQWWVRVVK
jgi:hypothetical protein